MKTIANSSFAQAQNQARPNDIVILELLRAKVSKDIQCCMPAIVKEYDRANNIVIVQLAANIKLPDGENISRGTISVPVWQYSGGGFKISFPLNEGDCGWVIAPDVDTINFWENRQVYDLTNIGQHSYENGFFLPDIRPPTQVNQPTDGSFAIGTLDGKTQISFSNGIITIDSPTQMAINSPKVEISGDAVIGGISFLEHVHGGVQGGNSTTSTPQ